MEIREFFTNLDPMQVFNIFNDTKDAVFLDSSKEDELLSKYSFIGINPIHKYEGFKEDKDTGFYELEQLVLKHKVEYDSELPFIGGYIGYISYDEGRKLEKLPETASMDFDIPDMRFILYENIIIFDLINKKNYISKLGILNNENTDLKYIIDRINTFREETPKKIEVNESSTKFESNFTKESYIQAISKIKDYIANGDIYIANMTQRYMCENNESAFSIYKKLREINKAPFSAYFNYDDFQIISSSPERFIKIEDGVVHTRPIKGTRPRGKTKEEDIKYRKELENSEKDKSELLMIVDLERNDLSKVCKNNSVKVTELFKIEEYAMVFHLVSTIEGVLKENVSNVKCIKECFPGGSITGAPKIRAMEIIEELEGIRRNIYTGCLGYFDLRGNSDFNIAIRTIIKKGNKAYFGVGGGITFESEEVAEYDETLDKAKALMRVL